jgi:hypothetical protein
LKPSIHQAPHRIFARVIARQRRAANSKNAARAVQYLPKYSRRNDYMEKSKELPFFARFLEDQEFPQVKTNIKAGRTLKYPSDTDEDVTHKYPSDSDEGGDTV